MSGNDERVEQFIRVRKHGRGYVTLDDLRNVCESSDWAVLHEAVRPHIESGLLVPVKSAKSNGMVATPVYEKYRIVRSEKHEHDLTALHPLLASTSYLEHHPESCNRFWSELQALTAWLREGPHERDVTLRERCWEVFGNEKASELPKLSTCIRRACGIDLRDLLCVLDDEPEDLPFAIAPGVACPEYVVVVENRDPFLAIRKSLREGKRTAFGTRVDAVVYGKGNVVRQTGGASLVRALESMGASVNAEVLYWGDIDREGLTILDALCKKRLARPFLAAYERMLAASGHCPRTSPDGRDLPMPDLAGLFEGAVKDRIASIASAGLLLPQEVLSARAIREEMA